ncbi:hypothetical protein IAG25_15800 [Caballeronia sp. EK]|uniref:hypothetical protein n=1 Tax=Caballeronia sp. EK TaxID=2767469 RepID=UPI0016564710|nr:hypothetical protein [Caballeronia sp. EK]MBC8638284.1 hypothetical protein [Caballeronia sp. EK]
MTRLPIKHECMWPSCHALVALDRWGCREHWYRLPSNLRSWIGRAYRSGLRAGNHPNRSYAQAHHAALAWIAAFEQGRPLPHFGPTLYRAEALTMDENEHDDEERNAR